MKLETVRRKRRDTAANLAKEYDRSPRSIRRLVAQERGEWLEEKRLRRLAILETYESDDALTREAVGRQFGIKTDTARQLGTRARKERAAAEREKIEPPLPLEELRAS